MKKADLLTREQATKYLKQLGVDVPVSTLEHWQFIGKLEGSRIGKRIYYTVFQLEQFVLKCLDPQAQKDRAQKKRS